MNGNKILAALSYSSVLFAPILFPIIVWIVGDAETKPHAKRALWTTHYPKYRYIHWRNYFRNYGSWI